MMIHYNPLGKKNPKCLLSLLLRGSWREILSFGTTECQALSGLISLSGPDQPHLKPSPTPMGQGALFKLNPEVFSLCLAWWVYWFSAWLQLHPCLSMGPAELRFSMWTDLLASGTALCMILLYDLDSWLDLSTIFCSPCLGMVPARKILSNPPFPTFLFYDIWSTNI